MGYNCWRNGKFGDKREEKNVDGVTTVVNGFNGFVAQNATLVGTLLLMMTGCFAITSHLGKIAAYAGVVLYGLAVVLALYVVSINQGPPKLVDIIVVVVCIASGAWSGWNLAHYHDRTSNGMVSQTD